MKQLLILQFRKTPERIVREQQVFLRSFRALPVAVSFKNAALDQLAWGMPEAVLKDATGVILGGSGDLDFDGGRQEADAVVQESLALTKAMEPFIAHLEAAAVPTLGICYGHQLLSHACGVPVKNDAGQAKAGTHTVHLTAEGQADPLFTGLPSSFDAQYGHKDALSCLPSGAVLLGAGEQCFFSAIRHTAQRYSLQFHPELNEDDMRDRFVQNPEFLPTGMTPDLLVRPSPHATAILANFVTHIM